MLRYFYYICFGFGAVFMAATQAHAGHCADHAIVVQRLSDVYGERHQSTDRGPEDALIEVFAAVDTGSWTITLTRPGGPTCLVAAGQGFRWQQHMILIRQKIA